MLDQLIVAHYIPLLIRRITSGPTGLDKPLGLMQSCLLGAFFPLAMDGEQGGYPNSSQSHRSRGRGCFENARGRSKSDRKRVQMGNMEWRPKTQSIEVPDTVFGTTEVSEPTSFDTTVVAELRAMGDDSDADATNHSDPVSDAESSVVESDEDME